MKVIRENAPENDLRTQFMLKKIVLQPTSLCNLNCRYCYLPHRDKNLKMSPQVAERLAEDIEKLPHPVSLIWHGGEPLSCGYAHFDKLVQPFTHLQQSGKVKHYIQTNATLLSARWCDFFVQHQFQVGVSLDGPAWATNNRVDWKDAPAFAKILHGINLLRSANIPFTVIAVVSQPSLCRAAEIYGFFSELGCSLLGINIEEQEGINQQRAICDGSQVTQFWSDLFQAWRANPVIQIREFNNILRWMKAACQGRTERSDSYTLDIFPTIAWNGDVLFLSPELMSADAAAYPHFVVGNIQHEMLQTITQRGQVVPYVGEFVKGIHLCKQTCSYFSFCQGGQASNKFYELGRFDGTETLFCRNSKQRLVEAVLHVL